MDTNDAVRQFLRHTLATLAYRAAKPLRDAPEHFSAFRTSEATRPAGATLAHMSDLFDWALSKAEGRERWAPVAATGWQADCDRFFTALTKFDEFLASDAPLHASAEALFQGPIADALTHVGQLAQMRRDAGAPIRGENYSVADIVAGRTGPEQTPPKP